ncbi:MAG TPA: hypothetical protein VGX68_18530 [Thermoanaerobaculia bacterium]|jgi:hypothetical protein|nr:hypothetical protein [Thermoanaerobaculia bacterium]
MTNLHPPADPRLRRVFFVLALLYLLPFWIVPYLPTTDGPCHTYNAWILRQHGNTAQYPLFQQYYEINWRPFPNWISQGTMALLMFVVPPLIAEKLLVSATVLLFLGGAWYLAGAVRPGERWPAFLAFPFAYHQLFQDGFYNFSVSLALFLFILGFWWRHRARPGLAFAVKINLLLWLCYFSHILSFMLALAAVGVLWLATLRRESWRRHLLHVPVLLPQVVLPLWFFREQGGGYVPAGTPFVRLLQYFSRLEVLATFSPAQVWGTTALAILFLLFLLLTLYGKGRRRRWVEEADVFLFLALAYVVLFLLSPEGMSGGGLIKQRLALYPYLLLIPWFAPRFGGGTRKFFTALLAAAALAHLGIVLYWYRVSGGEMERYLSALAAVRPNTRILALHYQRSWPTDALSHAIGYRALEKGLIDWDNYEAKVSFFPTHFRKTAYPVLPGGVLAPDSFRPKLSRDLVDAVYTWRMPPEAPLRGRLRKRFAIVSEGFGGELWELRQAGVESRHGKGKGERRRADRLGERRQPRDRPRGLPAARGAGFHGDAGKPGPGEGRGRRPESGG